MPKAKVWALTLVSLACAAGLPSHAAASEFPEEGSFATGIAISGTSAGIHARYHWSESLAVSLNATFSQFNREDISEDDTTYQIISNDDLRFGISPALRFYFGNAGPLWFTEIGVTLGYVKDEFESYFDTTTSTPTERYTRLSGWQYGLSAAAGLEHFVSEHVSVEGRFGISTGYSDLSGDEQDGGSKSVTTTNRTFFRTSQ